MLGDGGDGVREYVLAAPIRTDSFRSLDLSLEGQLFGSRAD